MQNKLLNSRTLSLKKNHQTQAPTLYFHPVNPEAPKDAGSRRDFSPTPPRARTQTGDVPSKLPSSLKTQPQPRCRFGAPAFPGRRPTPEGGSPPPPPADTPGPAAPRGSPSPPGRGRSAPHLPLTAGKGSRLPAGVTRGQLPRPASTASGFPSARARRGPPLPDRCPPPPLGGARPLAPRAEPSRAGRSRRPWQAAARGPRRSHAPGRAGPGVAALPRAPAAAAGTHLRGMARGAGGRADGGPARGRRWRRPRRPGPVRGAC